MEKEELYAMCEAVIKLNKQRYQIVKNEIEGIINNGIKNERYIESKLDEMLDILFVYENGETLLTFRRLCAYYLNINPQATVDYINIYKEQNDPEQLKFGNNKKDKNTQKRIEEDIER